jgi:aminoglycoside phosphotransferase family enzyme/predicted kinase
MNAGQVRASAAGEASRDNPLLGADGNGRDNDRVLAFLADPGAYHPAPDRVERIETHGAVVFLAGEFALKVKKAVHFSYMDLSTLALRERACRRELEINQPAAPEIYLDVVPITADDAGGLAIAGRGRVVEWAVRMRRFAQSELLSAIADRGAIGPDLARRIADAVAVTHARGPVAHGADPVGQARTIAASVIATLAEAGPDDMPAADVARLASAFEAEITRRQALLGARARAGFVRRVHGDLHLANVVLWQGEPRLFDAIEFDEAIATIDVLYDLAFLVMDLCHRGQRAAACHVQNRYLARFSDPADVYGFDGLDGLALLPLFLSLRAGVRAMVGVHRAAQEAGTGRAADLAKARDYLAAALDHLAPPPSVLVAIGGLSGTGKSTLAAALAPRIGAAPGAVHLRSDVERKAMFGVDETTRLPPSAYGPDVTAAVYARLIEKAGRAIAAGRAVIVDAVHGQPGERAEIEDVARRAHVAFHGFWLEAPAETLRRRVEARTGDASDATADVVDRQQGYDVGDVTWRRISTNAGAESALAEVTAVLVCADSPSTA